MPHGYMRVSRADRSRAIDVLRRAHEERRLDDREYGHRLRQVEFAAKTYADLTFATYDIAPQGGEIGSGDGPLNTTAMAAFIATLICAPLIPLTVLVPVMPSVAVMPLFVAHIAYRDVRENPHYRGFGLAVAAVILGYLELTAALMHVLAIFSVGGHG